MQKPLTAPRRSTGICLASAIAGASLSCAQLYSAAAVADDDFPQTATPIKHVVAIFQENISFDHYFGTYPHTQPNKDGTTYFEGARKNTPRVNNLESAGLLANNPNGVNPFRIDRSVPVTCDQDHGYSDEQAMFHGGLMDNFLLKSCTDAVLGKNSTFGYYDGNTVTALWNYAQHYALSDNSFGTSFGPSTPGLLNFLAGSTFGGATQNGINQDDIANAGSSGAVIGDADPFGDICSSPTRQQILMSTKNIGDLLNAAGVTWGAFMGGFGDTTCKVAHNNVSGASAGADYIPHHAFFQYWTSTHNPNHLPPSSNASIGKTDQANHQYDLSLFYTALANNHLPAVSIVKAAAYQDGHAGYSDPLDEQNFLVTIISAIMRSPAWASTAIVVLYDDSDGWYDHQMGPIVLQSNVAEDRLLGTGSCGTPQASDVAGGKENGRCGYGPRLPLMVISPYARRNYVDHAVTDQSSVIRFIEDNWGLGHLGSGSTDAIAGTLNGMFDFSGRGGAGALLLDPATGKVMSGGGDD
jgi:phospholipase C